MDPLARLFGSFPRLKLLRLFLFNDDVSFTAADASFRTKVTKDQARKEIAVLVAAGVVKKQVKAGKGSFALNKKFPHYESLQTFLRTSTNLSDTDVVSSLKRAGSLRLVVLTGMFTGSIESKIDLLVVGDRLEERPLENAVHALEAELGRELRFTSFSTEDFRYRLGVYDRLLRDVFDYPNRILLDKIGLSKN